MTIALILGCAVLPDGTPSPTFALRIDHGAGLYRSGRVSRICVTGGRGRHGPPEAHVARDRLIATGIPSDRLLVEDNSVSTVENIALAAPMVRGASVVLVSSRWHLPRAWLVARLLGLDAATSGPRGTVSARKTLTAILREVAATPSSVVRAVRWSTRNGSR